jgi:Flp pilus assembly protein TadG
MGLEFGQMFRSLTSFLKNTSGNFAIAFGLMMFPLALAVGAAVDTANANYVKTSLQKAADAAALAGGSQPDIKDKDLEKIVKDWASANGAEGVLASIKRINGKKDTKEGTFSVEISGKMNTTLMGLLGIQTLDVGAVSAVNLGTRALELSLALDVTGSMNQRMPTGETRMQALQAAAINMISTLDRQKQSAAELKVGVVPFAAYVNIGKGTGSGANTSGGGPNWDGCVGSRGNETSAEISTSETNYPLVESVDCPTSEIQALHSNLGKSKSVIASLTPGGYTYIPDGVLWGMNVLTPESPYNQGMDESEKRKKQGIKALVVMTDGDNTVAPMEAPYRRPASSRAEQPEIKGKADQLTLEACNEAKKLGIEVFTVSFMITNEESEQMLQECATSAAQYFNADNSAQLTDAFQAIGKKLAQLRLTR